MTTLQIIGFIVVALLGLYVFYCIYNLGKSNKKKERRQNKVLTVLLTMAALFAGQQAFANIYIPQNNKEYAISYAGDQNEMPLYFKSRENGEYTILVAPENVNVGYLHLIDNLTGKDIDLLQTPSYTFNARFDDYASRFKLVFNANENDNENEDFAFISNGEIFVNGTGILQVVDVFGHQLISRQVNSDFCLPTSDFSSGVYVLRLINGENVKTQKIVIK